MAMKESKEALLLAAKVAQLVEAIADGVDFGDLPELIAVGKAAGPGIKDIKLAAYEYLAASDADAAELEAYVQKELDLADDKVEAAIEMGFKVLLELRVLAALVIKPPTVPA